MTDKSKKPKKKYKKTRPRIEMIHFPEDMPDSVRLFERSYKENPRAFFGFDGEEDMNIRAHYFDYLRSQNFIGFIARKRHRPVGQIVAQIVHRSLGLPRSICVISNFWINPEERGNGSAKLLAEAFFTYLKSNGILHWEANSGDVLTEFLTKSSGGRKIKKLYYRIGGHT